MVLTPSTMLELGTAAPDFSLPGTNGKTISLADFSDKKALLVVFMCNHCPYVIHLKSALATFARDYEPKGLAVVGINSNDVENYPDDSLEKMALDVSELGYGFPYLLDESQAVAKAYQAACTPDFFLFDKNRVLVYRGQFDGSRPNNNVPVTGKDLGAAVETCLAGQPLAKEQLASMGCNIKWKPGNEPDYFG